MDHMAQEKDSMEHDTGTCGNNTLENRFSLSKEGEYTELQPGDSPSELRERKIRDTATMNPGDGVANVGYVAEDTSTTRF